MKDARLIFVLLLIAILSGTELVAVLTTVAPNEAASDVLWTFFICIFLFTGSSGSLLWHPIKKAIHLSSSISRLVSIRQSFLIASVITAALFLRSLAILSPWDLIPLAISALLIEFFFEADKRPSYNDSPRSA